MTKQTLKPHTMYRRRHYALAGSFSCLVIIFVAYIYFVSASIVHVVISQEINQKIVAVNAEISEYEATYIKLQAGVSSEAAIENGFVLATDKIYVKRAPTSLVLSQKPGEHEG